MDSSYFLALVVLGIFATNDVSAGKSRKGEEPNMDRPPPDDNMMNNNINQDLKEEYNYAECVLVNNAALDQETAAKNDISGIISMKQRKSGQGPVHIRIQMKGMDPDSSVHHGFHVHQYGDLTNGCNSAAGHFNPAGKTHGAPDDSERHVGDWGNIERNADGAVDMQMVDRLTSLAGGDNYIVGRAIVLHEKMDDLGKAGDAGSMATGNAGARLACCVIGLTGNKNW